MTSQLNISKNKTRKETSPLSNTLTHAMFESHPFVLQSKSDHHVKQPNLRTSLIQAQKYGHHLSKTNLANQSVPTAVQAKLNAESPVQLAGGEKRKRRPSLLDKVRDSFAKIAIKRKNKKQKISDAKDPAKADSSVKNEIKNADGQGNQRTFNHLQDVASSPPSDPKVQKFLSDVSPNNPNAKHNIAKIETTSRDKPVKGQNDLWGHGMNEPAGTRNTIPYTKQSAGLHPGINPTSSFKHGTTFNHLDIHQGLRTDTARTLFPDGTGHPGAVKLDPNKPGFYSGGNSDYDKEMDEVQKNTTTPAKRLRNLTAGHLNATAKPDTILDPKGPFTQGITVTGNDLSTNAGKHDTAKTVGEQRNRMKKLKIKTDSKIDMKNEPKGGTPPVSPIDKRFPVSSPTTPTATNPQLWKEYINQ